MSGNLLVRFDEGRVGRISMSPSLLLYRETTARFPVTRFENKSGPRIPHQPNHLLTYTRLGIEFPKHPRPIIESEG